MRLAIALLLASVAMRGECRVMAEVLPLAERQAGTPDAKLMTINIGVPSDWCAWLKGVTVTVRTDKKHTARPGDIVEATWLDKTKRGRPRVKVYRVTPLTLDVSFGVKP